MYSSPLANHHHSSEAMEAPESNAPRQQPPHTRLSSSNFIGRHRLQASVSLLQLQIKIIQDELQELETVGGSSAACDGLVTEIESSPDPLLPVTRGPADISWERWFGGGDSSRRHRRWI